MSKKTIHADVTQDFSAQPKTRREEILQEITEPGSISKTEKKTLVIPPSSTKASFDKTIKSFNIAPGSIQYRILKIICEEKRATTVDIKALIQRTKNFSNEQLKIVELICPGKDFTIRTTLEFIRSISKFGSHRLLALRAFVDLGGVGPGPLKQFFLATLPQGSPKEMGKEMYENEIKEKMMTPEQVNVFYNICHHIEDIKPRTAIALLSKTRTLKQQHAQIINTFLKKNVFFGDKPITNQNILGFINLWLSLPEMDDKNKFNRYIKTLSRQQDKKKKNFQYIVHSFKEKTETVKGKSLGSFVSNFSKFLE